MLPVMPLDAGETQKNKEDERETKVPWAGNFPPIAGRNQGKAQGAFL
jgi:hypothetical protein